MITLLSNPLAPCNTLPAAAPNVSRRLNLLNEFENELLKYSQTRNLGNRHLTIEKICSLLKIDLQNPLQDLKEKIDAWTHDRISGEKLLDDLVELLQCPLLLSFLNDPVLLDSGQAVSRDTLKDLKGNPFTGGGPLIVKEDPLLRAFLNLLQVIFLTELPDTDVAQKTIHTLCTNQAMLENSPHWCRILSVVMEPQNYFIRRKGVNHFVLEARLPLSYVNWNSHLDENASSVLKRSFSVSGKGELFFCDDPDEKYATLEDLCKGAGLLNFHPLSEIERQEIEQKLGKEEWKKLTHPLAEENQDRANVMKLLIALEANADDRKVTMAASNAKNANHLFPRAGISPTSFPSFTVAYLLNHNVKYKKITFQRGKLVFLKVAPFRILNQIPEVNVACMAELCWKPLDQLNPLDPYENAISKEWQAIKHRIDPKSPPRVLAFLPENPDVLINCEIDCYGIDDHWDSSHHTRGYSAYTL